jgi:hypothetical protein
VFTRESVASPSGDLGKELVTPVTQSVRSQRGLVYRVDGGDLEIPRTIRGAAPLITDEA